MIRAASSPAADALAAPEADCDYFAAETHYRSLANRIVAALRAGGSFILVTDHPPEGPHLLSQALRKSNQSRHEVIDIACRAGLTAGELTRARSVVAAPLLSGGATAALETSEPPPPLFVFADVDQLSDQQIREIFEGTQNGGRKGTAVLLLAPSGFLIRLEQPSLQFLKERLAARFEFYEVGQEEGIEFLRHQLTARHARGEPRGILPGIFRGLAASGVLLAVGIGGLSVPPELPIGRQAIGWFRGWHYAGAGGRGAAIGNGRDAGGRIRPNCFEYAADRCTTTSRAATQRDSAPTWPCFGGGPH